MEIAATETKFRHYTEVELRFNDFDMLGHLNNSVFFELTDLAKARFMEWLIHGNVDWLNWDLAVVNITSNFYAQIFPSDKIGVNTGVKSVSKHSFVIEQQVIKADSKQVCAVTTSVFCAFDRQTLRSKVLPEDLSQELRSML